MSDAPEKPPEPPATGESAGPDASAPRSDGPPGPGGDAAGRRRLLGRFHLGAASLLLVAIVVMLNYLAARHYERLDWTQDRVFTLSDRTLAELRGLPREVTVYLFLSSAEPRFGEVEELLDRYDAASERLVVEQVDPDRDPARFRTLAQRFGVAAVASDAGGTMADVAAVVVAGERRWTINRDDLIGLDYGSLEGEDGPKVDVKAEQAITGAIAEVVAGRATRVCATEGHGERPLGPGEATALFALAETLRKENVEVEAVGTRSPIPDGCDAVVVLGPSRPFGEDEARRLEDFARAGGGLVLALEPALADGAIAPTGLEAMLRRLGVEVDPTLVLELEPELLVPPASPPGPFLAADFGEHPVVEAPATNRGLVLMNVARSLRVPDGGPATALVRSSPSAFAVRDLGRLESGDVPEPGPGDVTGPLVLAAAVELEAPPAGDDGEAPRPGRVAVFGDVDWLGDDVLRALQVWNLDVARATVGWVTEREALVAIAPKQIDLQPLMITEDDLRGWFGIFTRVVLMIPAAFVLLGLSMWWWRRS